MLDTFADRELAIGREQEFWREVKDTLAVLPSSGATLDQWLTLNGLGHRAGDVIPEIAEREAHETTLRDAYWGNPLDPLANLISSGLTGELLIDEVLATNLSPTLDQIEIPTLILWGRYDFVVPPTLGTDAFSRIGTSDKEMWIFEHSAHSPMYDQPDEFYQVLADWISRH